MKLPLNQSGWVNNQMGCDEVASFHNLTANGEDIHENGYEKISRQVKCGGQNLHGYAIIEDA